MVCVWALGRSVQPGRVGLKEVLLVLLAVLTVADLIPPLRVRTKKLQHLDMQKPFMWREKGSS